MIICQTQFPVILWNYWQERWFEKISNLRKLVMGLSCICWFYTIALFLSFYLRFWWNWTKSNAGSRDKNTPSMKANNLAPLHKHFSSVDLQEPVSLTGGRVEEDPWAKWPGHFPPQQCHSSKCNFYFALSTMEFCGTFNNYI